jgi:hypothetical protein
MKIIGIVESDDYSGSAIVDNNYITLVQANGCWLAASKCMYSHLPVTCEISEEQARKFIENGVKCLNFDIEDTPTKDKRKRK